MSLIAIAKPDSAGSNEVVKPSPPLVVHLALAGCCAVLLAVCVILPPLGAMSIGLPLLEATVLLLPPLLVVPAYFHERKSWERRDAALMLPWTLVVAALVTQVAPTTIAHAFPLRDMLWRQLDEHLWINIPAIMAFTGSHPLLLSLLTFSYYWMLHPLLLSAIFLPACTGKRRAAQQFVLANAFAFVLALPFMLLLPAIGPWVAWHFAPNPVQLACESSIHSLRLGVISSRDSFGGIICFPSFHVFWAVISAHALQQFRFLRYPAILVAGLITLSTMSTGWHYGVDVIAGLFLAAVCTGLADAVLRVDDSTAKSGLAGLNA
ncbi:phosphatase PAP2 family protein [Telmatobacter sp. DSM 110680]|uniref:Phosphatase PAP2 family protein n=1 Tax=Telmatobacter sp. DSM 110680 TaxID=3036704 RepID=A0AAU7DHZ5_9BACT